MNESSNPMGCLDMDTNVTESLGNGTAEMATAAGVPGCGSGIGFEAGIRILLYAIIFVCAVVGNSLVILTLVQKRRMRTVTNVFLLNLAVSDLLLGVFCMPVTLVGSVLRNFVLGGFMCKLIPYLQAVSVSVSAWTLVSISLERFFAIVRPLESRRWQTTSHAYRVIILVWACSLLTMLPIAVLSQLVPLRGERKKCREIWPDVTSERAFNVYLDVILFLLPLVIMAFVYSCISVTLCHGMKLDNRNEKLMSQNGVHEEYHTNPNMPQLMTFPDVELRRQKLNRRPVILRGNYKKSRASKRRVIRMLSVLVLEFFVCWMPLYVLHTWAVFDAESAYSHVSASGIAAVHLLAYVSSCCNPITYCFMHDKYRQAFRNVLGCARKRRWSSTKSHDKFASTNSVCSASRNANAGFKPEAMSMADPESSSSCNLSAYCTHRTDGCFPSDTES